LLCDPFKVEIIAHAFCQLYTDIDIFWIKDIFYLEFQLHLQAGILLEIMLDLILQNYLDIEWKFNFECCIFCSCNTDWFGVNYTKIIMFLPKEIELKFAVLVYSFLTSNNNYFSSRSNFF